MSIHLKCYRCGKQGHSAVECKHKKAKCCLCQKVGHLARVCQTTGSKSTVHKDARTKASTTQKRGNVQVLQANDASGSSLEDHLHGNFQLGKKSNKYMITVSINGIMIEVDSGQNVQLSLRYYLMKSLRRSVACHRQQSVYTNMITLN